MYVRYHNDKLSNYILKYYLSGTDDYLKALSKIRCCKQSIAKFVRESLKTNNILIHHQNFFWKEVDFSVLDDNYLIYFHCFENKVFVSIYIKDGKDVLRYYKMLKTQKETVDYVKLVLSSNKLI